MGNSPLRGKGGFGDALGMMPVCNAFTRGEKRSLDTARCCMTDN